MYVSVSGLLPEALLTNSLRAEQESIAIYKIQTLAVSMTPYYDGRRGVLGYLCISHNAKREIP